MTHDFMPYKQELQLSLQNVSALPGNDAAAAAGGGVSNNWTSVRFVSWLLSADEKPLREHPRGDGGADEEDEKPLADL